MLIFDQLKRGDPQLRALTLLVLSGLGMLLAGLWWVQVVSARDYRESLENQSFRTVRIPAVRGKILDRNGNILAENRPTYNISLYLEELRKPFERAYSNAAVQARRELASQRARAEAQAGGTLSKAERRKYLLSATQKALLKQRARYEVASNVVTQVSYNLQQPVQLDSTNFQRHYETRLILPFPILKDLDPTNIARFQEQLTAPMGLDLEIQSTRVYPHQTLAAHLLGALKADDRSAEGEEAFFSYRLPDYVGLVGIEYGFDKELRGWAGAKSVQVNNIGYRTTENVWSPAEPGRNVVLTIDVEVQKAAENALRGVYGPTTRGAVVVMDVRTGDVLALASSPTINPNESVKGYTQAEWQWRQDAKLTPQLNRATQGCYAPGSVFKIIVGLAALEAGLNPNEIIHVTPNPRIPSTGIIYVGSSHRPVKDTAPPGDYDFGRALKLSCNTYFITNGLRVGPERIVSLGQKLHFGERIGLPLNQERGGSFPNARRVTYGWTEGNTANLSIGQDPVQVTPMQVAVLTAAVANGGKVLWPRLVDRTVAQDPVSDQTAVVFPSGQVRDHLGVSARSLGIVHDAMVRDTEDPDGTGKEAAVPGLRICGKTGTAQIQDIHGEKTGQTTWFASFAPYGNPRWAVVVMVEDGASGGRTCAPVGRKVYEALLRSQQRGTGKGETLASVKEAR